MTKIRQTLFEHLWLAFPCAMLLLSFACIRYVHIPLGMQAITEGCRLFRHYAKKHDASAFTHREERLRNDITLLDSTLRRIEARAPWRGGTLADEIYNYADSSGFTTGKVEIGIPQIVAGRRETAIMIGGSGPYRATGAFIERIENSIQSTRIRQLIIKSRETDDPEVFIDLTVREETAETHNNAGDRNRAVSVRPER